MKVSVIIPTYNREKCVIDLLECLFVQDYGNVEILVIDQSETLSADKERIISKAPDFLKYFHISERGRSLAKNYGIIFSTGDIVLFCDDDIIVPVDFISTHVKSYDDKRIGALSCRIVEEGQPSIPIDRPLRTTFYGRLINKAYSTKSCFVTSLNGGNMSFRRSALDQVGFFEEYFSGTSMVEEPDIAYRIIQSGYKIFFNAAITVRHYPQYNGNLAEINDKRADWFYHYFYNLCIFYLKYGRRINLFFVFLYCIMLAFKHMHKYGLGIANYRRMVSGYFDGLKKGSEIASIDSVHKYYSPARGVKRKYEPQ